jgi:hypothetical protein
VAPKHSDVSLNEITQVTIKKIKIKKKEKKQKKQIKGKREECTIFIQPLHHLRAW